MSSYLHGSQLAQLTLQSAAAGVWIYTAVELLFAVS